MEVKSQEVQEILGKPPSILMRWGAFMAMFFVILIGWGSYIFKYPDTVEDDIVVTSTEPPRRMVTQRNGSVAHILVENEDTVKAGQTLLVFSSSAKFEDVLTFEDLLLSVKDKSGDALAELELPKDLLLGDLLEDVYAFTEKQEGYLYSNNSETAKLDIDQLNRQIRRSRTNISSLRKQKSSLESQLKLVKERYVREQNLLKERLSTLARVRQMEEEVIAIERLIQSAESSIKSYQIESRIAQKEIEKLKSGTKYSGVNAREDLLEAFYRLQRKVDDWKEENLLVAPFDGIILITDPTLSLGQFVDAGKELMLLLPAQSEGIVGRIDLDLNGSGKVREGQKVVVDFESYPAEIFGVVEGRVSKKGKVPRRDAIPLEVVFPNGLVTTSDKVLEPSEEMHGKASIVVKDKRFIEWVFERFKKII